MDFIKKDIHMCQNIGEKCSELTIDEDFNIPDTKGDIEKLIAKQSRVVIDDISCDEGRLKVSGNLWFQLAYLVSGENPDVEFFSRSIPFEDNIAMDCINRNNRPDVFSTIEDFSIEVINSRKLSVRALVQSCVYVCAPKDKEIICGLENSQGVECLTDKICVTERPIFCQDVFHIKEELEIPQNKPNIAEVLWSDVSLRNMDFRAIPDGVRVTGNVEIFSIYKSEEEHLPIQYVYVVRSINQDISMPGVEEDMISDIKCALGKGEVSIRPDADGEDRVIGIDYNANVNVSLYVEHTTEFLKDAYSPQINLSPVYEAMTVDNLLMHNRVKTPLTQRRRVDGDAGRLMQICHIYGDVLVDDYWYEDGLHISGIVKVCVLYVASGNEPISAMNAVIPYEQLVELPDAEAFVSDGGNITDCIRISASINELSANMINSEEIDIKTELNLDIMAFSKKQVGFVTNIEVAPIDKEKKSAAPGIVGYVVAEGDTLWSLARRYYATTDSIREINELESDDIKPGDRLLIMKS